MTKDITLKEELLELLEKSYRKFLSAMENFDEQQLNTIPFEGSWTAAQVADHITRSNLSITKALQLPGAVINRNPFERVRELKNVFLNFGTKLKSPAFILPGQEKYNKTELNARLIGSMNRLMDQGNRAELLEMINHAAFGDITKFEILHFVVYHTQRHTHQLEKIYHRIPEPGGHWRRAGGL